jgi:lipopolysaccharide assembly outer membrane protein LptD (OstA)
MMRMRHAPRRAAGLLFLSLCLLVLGPVAGSAQDIGRVDLTGQKLPVRITADQIDYDSNDFVYTAEGRVRIAQKARVLTADWVMLDAESRIGVASGNVVLTDGDEVVRSDFMEFNIDTLAGVVYRGRFEDTVTKFRITGDEIRRLADKEYRLQEGTFTTCDCGPGQVPSWRIDGDRVDVTVNGYAKVHGVKFKVKDKPVVYVPFGIFPVKTTRQSGLLFPSIGNSSRNGFEFNLPYYWAISENTDATFYQDILGKRGLKEGVEFRYIFQPETYGQANVWYLNDQDVNSKTPFGKNRWAVRWQHRQKFPFGVYGKADVNNVSDNRYPIDFEDIGRDSNRFLESKGHLERPFNRGTVLAGIVYGDDLQSPDNLDRDSFVLQRMPYVQANLIDQPAFDSPLRFEWNSSFVNFHQATDPKDRLRRRFGNLPGLDNATFLDTGVDGLFSFEEPGTTATNPYYIEFRDPLPDKTNPATVNPDPHRDDFFRIIRDPGTGDNALDNTVTLDNDVIYRNPKGTENDGRFEEGEILANSGQRIDLYPRASLPLQLGKYVDLRPEIGFRETIWHSNDFADATTHRNLFTGRLDVSTQLEKEWGSPLGRWKSIHHTVKPQFTFLTIQGSDDKFMDGTNVIRVNHPVFVPPGSTNESRQRQFAFDNVLEDQSDVIPDQTILFYSSEHEFFARESGEDGTSRRILRGRFGTGYDVENNRSVDSIAEAVFEPTDDLELFTNATYNNEKDQIDRFNIGGVLSDNRGDQLGLSYRLSKSFAAGFEEFKGNPDFKGFKRGFDEISELNTNLRLRLLSNVDFHYRSNYSFNVDSFFRQVYSLVYRSKCKCWSTNLSVVDRARAGDTQVRVLLNLEGLGAIGNASRNP